MKKVFLFGLIIILFSSFVIAGNITIYSAECFKDGSGKITVKSDNKEDKIYTKDIEFNAEYLGWYGIKEKSLELSGEWENEQRYLRAGTDKQKEYGTFIADEALFRDSGEYAVNVKYKVDENSSFEYDNFKVVCVGMIFSCTLINIEVEECKTTDNKKFEAVFDIKGVDQSDAGKLDLYEDIEYVLRAKNNYEDIKEMSSEVGSLPKGFSMVDKDDKYHLSYEFEDNFIYSVVAKFHGLTECRNTEKYPNISMYSYKECDLFESEKEVEEKIVEEEITEEKIVEEEITEKKIEKNNNWLFGLLIGVIVFLIVILIVVLKKQKTNKW